MKTSLTGIGAVIVTVLNLVFPLFNIDVESSQVESFVVQTLNIIGFITLIWGQARRPDVKNFLLKH